MLWRSSTQMGSHKSVTSLDLEHLLLLPLRAGGMSKDLEIWFCPFFPLPRSLTLLFLENRGSRAVLHPFPKPAHFFPSTQSGACAVIKHRSDSHSMTTENAPVCTAEKKSLNTENALLGTAGKWTCREKIPVAFTGEYLQDIYTSGVRRRWMSCAGMRRHSPAMYPWWETVT